MYDRILRKEYWTPKEDTDYTIVLDILENTFTENMKLTSDPRFYFKTLSYPIPIGMTGRVAINVKTWSSFDSVTGGSIWLHTIKTVTGTFRAKVSILLGTYTADNLPDYQPYRPPTSIDLPLLRAIPDGNDGFSARDSLTPVKGMSGWYDLRREVGVKVFDGTESIKSYVNGLYYEIKHKAVRGLCTHFTHSEIKEKNKFTATVNSFAIHFHVDGTPEEFKTMLSDQYTAGTPVTVWYALEEPATERIELGTLSTYPYYTHIYSDCAVEPLIEGEVKTIGGQTPSEDRPFKGVRTWIHQLQEQNTSNSSSGWTKNTKESITA